MTYVEQAIAKYIVYVNITVNNFNALSVIITEGASNVVREGVKNQTMTGIGRVPPSPPGGRWNHQWNKNLTTYFT